MKPLSFHAAIVPVSGAEPGVSSDQSLQINVRGKIADETGISKVNRGDGGVTCEAVGDFTSWEGLCALFYTVPLLSLQFNNKGTTNFSCSLAELRRVSVYVCVNFVLGCFERVNGATFAM